MIAFAHNNFAYAYRRHNFVAYARYQKDITYLNHKLPSPRSFFVAALLLVYCNPKVDTASGQHTNVLPQERLIYYHSLRVKAEKISLTSIKELRFYGAQLGCFENRPIKVTNTRTISTFLQALRHAYTRRLAFANGINTLEIRFRPEHRHTREPLVLQFNTSNPADCFGPEFYAAIHKLVPNAPAMPKPVTKKVPVSKSDKATTTKKAATPAKKVTRRNAPPPNPLLEQKQRRGSDDKQP